MNYEIIDGVLHKTDKTVLPGSYPIPDLTQAEHREQAYNEKNVIPWDGDLLTVTEAAQRWAYYAAEGNSAKTDELTALIAEAKAEIRAKYPDNAGGT